MHSKVRMPSKSPPTPDDPLTYEQAAVALGLSRATVARMVAAGKLKSWRYFGRLVVSKAEVDGSVRP